METTQIIAAVVLVGLLGWALAPKEPLIEPSDLLEVTRHYQKLAEQEKRERRESFVEENPDISDMYRDAILDGVVMRGMTPEMVIAAHGEPEKINESTIAGYTQQWVYNGQFIYFRRGANGLIVDSWQTF